MPSLTPELISALTTLATTAVAGVVGIFRLRESWLDRVKKAKTESATQFRDHDADQWAIEFGKEQLRRFHFCIFR